MSHAPKPGDRYWSAEVTRNSRDVELEGSDFVWGNPHEIALAIKRAAERSRRHKSDPYGGAVNMLNFYVSRAGRELPEERRAALEEARIELKRLFGISD